MTIYETINEQLQDKTIDAAQVAGTGFAPSFGRYLLMDDGTKVLASDHDYWLINDNLEEMAAYWRELCRRDEMEMAAD